jgi:hypothetical protein
MPAPSAIRNLVTRHCGVWGLLEVEPLELASEGDRIIADAANDVVGTRQRIAVPMIEK